MSLFGKLMAVLNLIGVVAVVVMALLVYSQRRVWEYTVHRADLAVNGLPIDKQDMDNQDYFRALDLGSPTGKTLKELFPANPVTTQVEEVDRVKKTLDATLSGVNSNPPAHMQALAGILLPLSVSNAEREYYLTIQTQCNTTKPNENQPSPWDVLQKRLAEAYDAAKINAVKNKSAFAREFALALRFPQPVAQGIVPPQGLQVLVDAEPREPFEAAFIRAIQPDPNVAPVLTTEFATAFNAAVALVQADLVKQYDAAFEVALKGQHTGSTGTLPVGQEQRRHAIARLLIGLDVSVPKPANKDDPMNIDTDLFRSTAFKRVANVIGLQEVDAALTAEAIIYARISLELDKEAERERTTFMLEQATLLAEAKTAAQKLAQQDDQVKELKDKVAALTALVALREANVAASRNELAARRAYTAQLLDMIHQMEDAVHTTRVEVRDINAVNQGYVKKIQELENKR